MDDADRANDVAQMHLDLAIAHIRGRRSSTQARRAPRECQCCGEPIPEARRIAVPATRWCVYCAHDRETQQRNALGSALG
jgi:phage/conjugal plasmid C-4 type zinc finger TraR family protein